MTQISVLEIQATVQADSVALEAVADLFQALNQNGIRYCHWKSNLRLTHGLQGKTDLDLLVDRKHSQVCRQILFEHNVKPVRAAPGKQYPAVEDYLGFDPASGKLFHLHVHYQLVLGEQFVKNSRLPLESYFLDSVQLRHGVKIPAPEYEVIVLAIRALLKYRDRDVIKDVLSIRSSGLPDHILEELGWLLEQTSMARISETLTEVADIVPADVVLEFLQTVVATPRAGYKFYRLRGRVRQALNFYQRASRLQATATYFQEAWRRRKSFLRFSPELRMTLLNGGVTLAFIGADGAGKSTLCQTIVKWLSWKLDVHHYYLGSKQPSRRSAWLYLLFRMFRRGHRAVSHMLGEANVFSEWVGGIRDGFLYAHYLSIGQDRYRRYLAGRKKAAAGSIVIYDRYPLESISTRREHRLLDGPQIPQLTENKKGAVARAFARTEENLYQNIRLPDYLVVLNVSPEVSLQRKPDHKPAVIEAKSRAVGELISMAESESRKLNVVHLNADLPFEDVLRQLKTELWELL